MQYTEKELTKLLADVEKEFTSHLAKAEESFRLAKSDDSAAPSVDGTTLAKAEDDSAEAKDKKEEPKSEDAAPEAKEEAPAKEAAPEAEGEAEGEAEAPAPEAEAAAPAAEGEAHGYDEEDLAHLRQMYSEMSFAELMAHHDAVKECLDAQSAQEAAPAPDAAAPALAADAAPAEAAAPADEAMPFAKSEVTTEVALVKSENSALMAKNEQLSKDLTALSEFVGKLLTKKGAPAAKAITQIESLAKSEKAEMEVANLSKGEITSILSKKAADPKTSTSDRQAINSYYGAGQVSIEKISHLLK